MTAPPLVVTGQSISAAHMNLVRSSILSTQSELYAWTLPVAAGGQNLTNVGALSAASLSVTGAFSSGSVTTSGSLTAASGDISGTLVASSVIATSTLNAGTADLDSLSVENDIIVASGKIGLGVSTPAYEIDVNAGTLAGAIGSVVLIGRFAFAHGGGNADSLVIKGVRASQGSTWDFARIELTRIVDGFQQAAVAFDHDDVSISFAGIERFRFYSDGNMKRVSTPVYASNAAAVAAGLGVGMEYRTSAGVKMEVF